jgi:hypothetical protein
MIRNPSRYGRVSFFIGYLCRFFDELEKKSKYLLLVSRESFALYRPSHLSLVVDDRNSITIDDLGDVVIEEIERSRNCYDISIGIGGVTRFSLFVADDTAFYGFGLLHIKILWRNIGRSLAVFSIGRAISVVDTTSGESSHEIHMDCLYSFDSFFDREGRGIVFPIMDLLELRDQSICYCHDVSDLLSQLVRVGGMIVISLAIQV